DEGQRQDPDRAVEPAGNPDPGPEIGNADYETGNRDRNGRYQVDAAPSRDVGAVDGVADRKGQRAADRGGDDTDLQRIVDRVDGQGIVEDAVEMHQRILPHVDQAGGVADEHELAERRHDQREARQDHDPPAIKN